jgi:16S rRNA (uracil1498-N3)-methyltransferase
MAIRRFRVDHLGADSVRLGETEAHHAVGVLRLAVGDEVIVFDGRGLEANGRIVEIRSGDVIIAVDQARQIPLPVKNLTLAVATPKGERADWMVEKCAELGVTRLIPLRTERGQVSPGKAKLDRWRRKADEAAKQSSQARTLLVEDEMTIPSLLSTVHGSVLFGDRDAEQALLDALKSTDQQKDAVLLIGPEGGFTDGETSAMKAAGGRPIRLAESILRVETAAVAAASVWAQWQIGCFDGSDKPS